MRLFRAAFPAFAVSCLAALVASACGHSSGSGVHGGAAGANGSGANGTGASSTGASSNIGGSINLGLGGDGETMTASGASSIDECAGDTIQAERIPLDMYVMLDVSGSMLAPTDGNPDVTKWQAVSSALVDFVNDKASDGLGMGLQVFPIRNPDAPTSCATSADCGTHFGVCFAKTCWNYPDGLVPCEKNNECGAFGPCVTYGHCSANAEFVCPNPTGQSCGNDPMTNKPLGTCMAITPKCTITDDCRSATYATAAAPIAELPGAQAGLVKVIEAAMPEDGLTPTGPALTGALQQASTWAKAHSDHQVVAVLATDGIPTIKAAGQYCAAITNTSSDADITAVISVAGGGFRSMPSVSTFVIGVASPDDVAAGAPDVLDAIAKAGGTGQAFIVNTQNDVQVEFRNALNMIRAAGLSCDLAIPKAPAGQTLDFGLVNVRFDDGKGAKTLGNVKSEADCGNEARWYYDVDPKVGTPTRILTCPAACDAFQKTDMGSVKIVLGCETEVVVK